MRFSAVKKARTRRAIGSLVLLAFLSLTLFDSHYHFHHDDPSSAHGSVIGDHVLDFHTVLDPQDAGHDLHSSDSHSVDVDNSLGLAFKSSADQLPLLALLLTLILLLPVPLRSAYQSHHPADTRLPCRDRHKLPPLRAPPRG